GNKFLTHIREVDAIMQVCRCFDDPDVIHVAGKVDPLSDIETVEIELLLADGQTIDAGLSKAERAAKGGDKEMIARAVVLQKCKEQIAKDEPLRKVEWTKDEKRVINVFGLLSAK